MDGFEEWFGEVTLTQCLLALLATVLAMMPKDLGRCGVVLMLLVNGGVAIYAVTTDDTQMRVLLTAAGAASLVGLWFGVGKARLAAYRERNLQEWTCGHV